VTELYADQPHKSNKKYAISLCSKHPLISENTSDCWQRHFSYLYQLKSVISTEFFKKNQYLTYDGRFYIRNV